MFSILPQAARRLLLKIMELAFGPRSAPTTVAFAAPAAGTISIAAAPEDVPLWAVGSLNRRC